MKITKPDDVIFLQGYVQRGGRKTFIATVGYVVEADGSLLPESAAWAWLAQQFPDQPFDTGLKKSRGVFGVAGKAYAPGGTPVAQMAVRARFGALGKTLHVFGRRQWQRGALGWQPSSPEPFTEMPIDLAHAFGGPGYAENPYGLGWIPEDKDARDQPLPHIELPDAPVLQPHAVPPSIATFGNLALGAPSRMKWLGTVDEHWLEKRFPALPDDLDPRWFDIVPQDQGSDAYWHGDEVWSVTGMHPSRDTVEGQLPRLRPRLLVQKAAGSPWASQAEQASVGAPFEVPLDLDTVWLFPNDARVLLLYRAAIPVSREDAADIAALAMFTEPAAQPPAPVPALTQKWVEDDFSVVDSIPEILTVLAGVASAAVLVKKILDHRKKKKEEKAQQEAQAEQSRQQAQQSPVSAPAPATAEPASVQPTVTDMAASERERQQEAARQAADAARQAALARTQRADAWADRVWDQICRSYAASWDEGRQLLELLEKENKEDFPDGFGVKDPGPFQPPPRPSLNVSRLDTPPPDLSEQLQSRVEASLAEGRQLFLDGLRDAMGDHPEMLEVYEKALLGRPEDIPTPTVEQAKEILQNIPPEWRERAEEELRQMQASFDALHQEIARTFQSTGSGAAAASPSARSATVASAIDSATQSPVAAAAPAQGTGDAQMAAPAAGQEAGAAPDAPVSSRNEPGSHAPRDGRAAAAATAAAAVAAPLVLKGRSFRSAALAGADYSGATLQECDFSGANLAGARFDKASIRQCSFEGADLSNASLAGADLTAGSMRGARLVGADARRASFDRIEMSGADLSGAQLERAIFDRCYMHDVCLSQANLTDTSLSGVDGERVDLRGSQAKGLRIDEGTRLPQVNLQGAVLTGASIQNSVLPSASMQGTDLNGALLQASDLSGSVARGVSARGAIFKDMQLADTTWLESNLMETTFDHSLLHRVDFTGSNLYAAQTRNAQVQGVQLRDTMLDLCHILQEQRRA